MFENPSYSLQDLSLDKMMRKDMSQKQKIVKECAPLVNEAYIQKPRIKSASSQGSGLGRR